MRSDLNGNGREPVDPPRPHGDLKARSGQAGGGCRTYSAAGSSDDRMTHAAILEAYALSFIFWAARCWRSNVSALASLAWALN
jgi:hypothetical protein